MLKTDADLRDTVFVLFGAGGDLASRLIVPALFNLHLDGHLPTRFLLLGADRGDYTPAALADHFRQGVADHSRRGAPADQEWQAFAAQIGFQRADIGDAAAYAQIGEQLLAQERAWGGPGERVFYLATPPSLIEPVARGLGGARLADDRERVRVVVEKPLGRDWTSFRDITRALCQIFTEPQVFRIDHFLGKETVQNILAMRFADPIFEPIWNRRYVDHVAITVAETLGVEHRGGYYEQAGALRDMVQNHLLQLLCLVAMEPPVAYSAADIHGKKLDVLRAIRPIPHDGVPEFAARGQYGGGWIRGVSVPAYRDEPRVGRSRCPTRAPGRADAAGAGHRAQVPGQGTRVAAAPAAGGHAVQLQGRLPAQFARRLRNAAVGRDDGGRHAVHERESGGSGVATVDAGARDVG